MSRWPLEIQQSIINIRGPRGIIFYHWVWYCITISESLKQTLALTVIYLRVQGELFLNMGSEMRLVNFRWLNKGFTSKFANGSPYWVALEKGRREQRLKLVIITIKMKTLVWMLIKKIIRMLFLLFKQKIKY